MGVRIGSFVITDGDLVEADLGHQRDPILCRVCDSNPTQGWIRIEPVSMLGEMPTGDRRVKPPVDELMVPYTSPVTDKVYTYYLRPFAGDAK